MPPKLSFRLFSLAGVPIYVHVSVVLLVALGAALSGSLEHYGYRWTQFPVQLLFFLVGLFVHEWGHAYCARRIGLPVVCVTLNVLGGNAVIGGNLDDPKQEFWVSLAGPVASLLLGGGFYTASQLLPEEYREFCKLMTLFNLGLGVLNLLPAFFGSLMTDGARLVRALLSMRGDPSRALQSTIHFSIGVSVSVVVAGAIADSGLLLSAGAACLLGAFDALRRRRPK
ncbi:MAG: site-2 protease family protein [Planctomycetota bacterium]